MNDNDYYDIDGIKLCDGLGNSIVINDGTRLYDLETGQDIYDEEIEEVQEVEYNEVVENYYITSCAKVLYFIIFYISKLCEMFFSKSKNREI